MDDILVDVTSRLPGLEDKQFGVATSENNTVAGLIRKLCKENHIPMRTSYTLRDSKERILPWSQTLVHCGIKHGAVVYLTNDDEDVHITGGCSWNSWWFVAAMSLLIGGVGITAISILFTRNGKTDYQFGVVLDAGSSHTKLFIYKWDGAKFDETAVAKQVYSCPVAGGGITSYEKNISSLSGPLTGCLDLAKQHIAVEKHKTTPIFLGATAGMRMLDEVSHSLSDKILSEVRRTIGKTPFSFSSPRSQARIISGQEEGTFGWVTANYVLEKLRAAPPTELQSDQSEGLDTVGALDMGGASTQITFYSSQQNIPADYREDLMLYGSNYSVYTHSYLCYGINEALRRYQAILVQSQGYNESMVASPCGPVGNELKSSYAEIFEAPCANRFKGEGIQQVKIMDKLENYTFNGTGDEQLCQDTVEKLFNFSAQCPNCTFNGTYQPPLQGQFFAFSSFFYEMDFLNLTTTMSPTTTLDEFTTALSTLCKTPWDVVKTMKTGDGKMRPWYCFEGHFIHTLLVKAYKFNKDNWGNIHFVKQINETDIGWTLGYMLNSSNVVPEVGPITYISTTAFSALTVLFSIFLVLSVGFGCYAKRYQQQKVSGLYERVPTYGAV